MVYRFPQKANRAAGINSASARPAPDNHDVPHFAAAGNTALDYERWDSRRAREHPRVECFIGCFYNPRSGEVRFCPCGRWRCAGCGPQLVRRFLRRVNKGRWFYLVTLTLDGDGAPTRENIRRLNKSWRVLLRWLQRRQKRRLEFSWVNEQGSLNGRLHKHVLIDCDRFDYFAVRRAIVRAGLGKVCDFQRVHDKGAANYCAKYLTKSLSVVWPTYTRRCQTTIPREVKEEGWKFFSWSNRYWPSAHAPAEVAERDRLRSLRNWYPLEKKDWLVVSLDEQRESASARAP